MKKNLTILLPLFNRSVYTERWLRNNVVDLFDYYLCDGGDGYEDEKIVADLKDARVLYKRFPPDTGAHDYLLKIRDGLGSVKTPYVMLADNDDFIVPRSLETMIGKLRGSKESIGVHGRIGSFWEVNGRFTKTIVETNTVEHLCNISGFDGVYKCTRDYNYFHYAIIDTEVQREVFSDLVDSGCNNFYLAEIFHSLLLFSRGELLWSPEVFYVRQRNSLSSNASNDLQRGLESPKLDCILNENYFAAFKHLCSRVAALCKVQEGVVSSAVRFLLISDILGSARTESSLARSYKGSLRSISILRSIRNLQRYRYDISSFIKYLDLLD